MPSDNEEERPPVTTMRTARQRVRQPSPERDDAPVSGPPDDEPDFGGKTATRTRTRTRPPAEEPKSNGKSRTRATVPDTDDQPQTIRGGWTEAQQIMDSTANFAQALKPTSEMQFIQFLGDTPYANYKRHWIEKRAGSGQLIRRPYICLETVGKECPLCDIGERPQAVSSFNVALIGDDGQMLLKSFDVGAKLFKVLQGWNNDRKVGPLSKNIYSVTKTGSGNNSQTNVTPIIRSRFKEDFDIDLPTPDAIKKIGLYDPSILQVPRWSELDEIAQEIADDEG